MQGCACMFVCAHGIRLPSGIWIHMIEECSRVDDPRNLDIPLMDRNPKQPPGMFLKPYKIMGYLPYQLVSRISEPSTVSPGFGIWFAGYSSSAGGDGSEHNSGLGALNTFGGFYKGNSSLLKWHFMLVHKLHIDYCDHSLTQKKGCWVVFSVFFWMIWCVTWTCFMCQVVLFAISTWTSVAIKCMLHMM